MPLLATVGRVEERNIYKRILRSGETIRTLGCCLGESNPLILALPWRLKRETRDHLTNPVAASPV